MFKKYHFLTFISVLTLDKYKIKNLENENNYRIL